jgi:putative SOS response-associated peptidase YedK
MRAKARIRFLPYSKISVHSFYQEAIMCGRFTLTVDPAQLQEAFPLYIVPQDISPRYNIAPTQPVAVVPNTGENKFDFFVWGLIPSWAKDPEIGSRMINARAETLAEKPSFRTALRRRRCLIPASGFYEWKQSTDSKAKTPMYIHLKSGKPFAFAGLWDLWNSPDGSQVYSCTIITGQPNSLVQTIHNRMPVILQPESYPHWLIVGDQRPEDLAPLLKPYPAEEMEAYPVSKMVNSPQNDLPECILPITA